LSNEGENETGQLSISADRVPYVLAATRDEVEDAEALLRDLEEIIHEILPPEQAEAAYVAALRHLLTITGGEAVLATDRLFERICQSGSQDR
jgi:hypothetical protein